MVKRLFVVLLVCVLSACSPSLERTLKVDYVEPESVDNTVKASVSAVRVKLGEFSDLRRQPAIGEIDGRKLLPDGDVALSAKMALQDGLREAGASIALYGDTVVSGEVTNWFVQITPGFPLSKVEASATMRLRVERAHGKSTYSALYSGSIEQKHPFLTQTKVEKSLGDAMAIAVKEALKDDNFVAEISGQVR